MTGKRKRQIPKRIVCFQYVMHYEITPEQLLTGKGINPEYKDADIDYEVTRSDIKILKQITALEMRSIKD